MFHLWQLGKDGDDHIYYGFDKYMCLIEQKKIKLWSQNHFKVDFLRVRVATGEKRKDNAIWKYWHCIDALYLSIS